LLFGRRKRLASSLAVYRQKYLYYDPFEVGNYVRRVVAEYVGRRKREDLIYILEDVIEVRKLFPFNGLIASITFVVESIVDNVINLDVPKKHMRKAMETLVRLYERADEEFIRRASHMLSSEIIPGSTLLLPTGGQLLEQVLFEIRARLEGMMVPVGEPLLMGARFAGRIHRHGIPSLYIPDSARGWAVRRSDFVIIPLYGLTTEGHIVTDAGVRPLVRLAWDEERRVYAIGPRTAFYPVERASDLERNSFVELKAGRMRVRAADIIDVDEGEVYLATDREVLRATSSFLVEEAKHVRSVLEQMAMEVISAYFGKPRGGFQ